MRSPYNPKPHQTKLVSACKCLASLAHDPWLDVTLNRSSSRIIGTLHRMNARTIYDLTSFCIPFLQLLFSFFPVMLEKWNICTTSWLALPYLMASECLNSKFCISNTAPQTVLLNKAFRSVLITNNNVLRFRQTASLWLLVLFYSLFTAGWCSSHWSSRVKCHLLNWIKERLRLSPHRSGKQD